MGHTIELTDEQFQILAQAAAIEDATPDTLLARLIVNLRDPNKEPRYYQTYEWLQHLGTSDEELADIAHEADADALPRSHSREAAPMRQGSNEDRRGHESWQTVS